MESKREKKRGRKREAERKTTKGSVGEQSLNTAREGGQKMAESATETAKNDHSKTHGYF